MRLPKIAREGIADAGSIPATSTNLCRVARRSLGSDAAGPAPYGGVLVSTRCCECVGGNEQATGSEGANHKGQLLRGSPADGCLTASGRAFRARGNRSPVKFAGAVDRAALIRWDVPTTHLRPALLYPARTSKSPSGAARDQLNGRERRQW